VIYYIEAQKIAANVHVKAFEYAKSFDDILKIISKTDDIDALKSIRYSLVTKLMQATTLQNLNRSKGVDLDNEKSVMASAGGKQIGHKRREEVAQVHQPADGGEEGVREKVGELWLGARLPVRRRLQKGGSRD
jgi:hypothetical protein